MNEQLQTEELSLMDLLKVLLSKIKILILVLLCGGIIGGTFGVLTTYNENYWGTNMEFYVNPERPEAEEGTNVGSGGSTYGVYGAYGRHVMDNIVKLLNSESFSEKLILNGALLPEKNVWINVKDEKELALGLNKKIDDAQEKINQVTVKKKSLDEVLKTKNEAVLDLNEKTTRLNEKWREQPLRDGKVVASIFNEGEYFAKKLEIDYPELAAAYQAMQTATSKVENQNKIVSIHQTEYSVAKKNAEESTNVALSAWRKTAKYRENLLKILSAIEFSYVEEEADLEDAVNLARSFIYVNISVLGDENKDFSEDLMLRVQTELPKYVSEKMIIPDGYSGTSCTEITTTSEIGLTNPLHTTKAAVKYAILLGAAALMVAAVIIIIIDRSDKRVRDYDVVARQLNVPLLGVVPSINEENIAAWNKENMGKGE